MNIVIIIDSLATGGAEKSMVDFATYLKNKGEQVTFICLERREISREIDVVSNNISLIYLKQKSFIRRGFELKKIIKKIKPDIIHSVLVQSNIQVRFLRILTRRGRVIQSLVNTPYSYERKKDTKLPWRKFLMAKQIDKWSARLVPSFYHAITRTVLEHYKPIYSIKENYKIIYRGREDNKYLKFEDDDQKIDLINVGRQEFAKGQIDILKALVFLEREYGILIKLKILGFEGKSTDDLQNFIKDNNLGDRVHILGFVRDVEKHLSNASIFVFPSYYEGLGGALIEAFAAKLPVICSDLPVLQEVVGNSNNALFCPPGDYICLGEQIRKLVQDPDLRKRLSQSSYDRFQKTFRIESINEEMFNMYKLVLQI